MTKALFNWSGGKDSAMGLYQVIQQNEFEVRGLLTSFNSTNNRVSMHGVCRQLLEEQVQQIGLTLYPFMLPENIGMEEYSERMKQALIPHQKEGITTCIFGDIFLKDLRSYREQQLQRMDMKAAFPLWRQSTKVLAGEFIEAGFKAVVVAADGSHLDASFVGRSYDEDFLADLPEDVDPCGEYGAFHTFVYDGPIFNNPVSFIKGEIVEKSFGHPDKDDAHSFNKSSLDKDTAKTSICFYMDLLSPPDS